MECRILDKTRLFCTGARVESLSPAESAWSAEYSIKHNYSAQARVESLNPPESAWSAEYLIKHDYRVEWNESREDWGGVECGVK